MANFQKETDYVALSPGAGYDANRNQRILARKQDALLSETRHDEYEIQNDGEKKM